DRSQSTVHRLGRPFRGRFDRNGRIGVRHQALRLQGAYALRIGRISPRADGSCPEAECDYGDVDHVALGLLSNVSPARTWNTGCPSGVSCPSTSKTSKTAS